MTLYRVDAPYFCAGFTVTDGYIDRAAPIIGWMVGKTLIAARRYCEHKGWVLEDV